jgi:preprotein translocase subunit SecG
MLYGFILFVHIIVSIGLVIVVLLQSSKGGGLAGSIGGYGSAGGFFGGRGAAPFLVKATTVCAIMFMLTSISLNFVSSTRSTESVLERTLMESGGIGSEPAVMDEMPISTDAVQSEQSSEDSENSTENESSQQPDE